MFHPKMLTHILSITLAAITLSITPHVLSAPTAESFRLPSTPGGLDPLQCWYALGNTPDGSIYIAASDHKTNSALFEKRAGDQAFRYVGDAQQASMQANNWAAGETLEKFHVRPTYLDGDIYLGGLNYSYYNKGYTKKRGFHWYRYRPSTGQFTDLSANTPDGTASPFQLEYLIADPRHHRLYGAAVPKGHLVRFDPHTQTTYDLGRPPELTKNYLPSDSFMWVNSRGRVYFAMEGRGGWFKRIHYFDPDSNTFGTMDDWKLQGPPPRKKGKQKQQVKGGLKSAPIGRIPKVGQCEPSGKRCYMSDNNGRIYRWRETDNTEQWTYLGQVRFPAPHEKQRLATRTFQLSADEKSIYMVNERYLGAPDILLHRFDITAGRSEVIAPLSQLAPEAVGEGRELHCGHNAWDAEGRFYIASFGMSGKGGNVVVTAIKP